MVRKSGGKSPNFAKTTFTQTYSTTATTVPTITSGAGTGADGTTPSGAEHALAVDDITENRKLIGMLIDILQAANLSD